MGQKKTFIQYGHKITFRVKDIILYIILLERNRTLHGNINVNVDTHY